MCTCNFIYSDKKSKTLPVPILQNLEILDSIIEFLPRILSNLDNDK